MLMAALCSCASAGGDWPSLRTRAERHVDAPIPAPVATLTQPVAVTPVEAIPDAATEARVQPLASRIEQERRSVNFINERWHKQQTVLAAALAAVKKKGPTDINWSKAQTELTRLNQIAGEFDDALNVVNTVTGQLAVVSAEGATVTKPLAAAGKLIKIIETAQKEAIAANTGARRRL